MAHFQVDLVVENDGGVECVREHDFVVCAGDALDGGDGWIVGGPRGGVIVAVEGDFADFYA